MAWAILGYAALLDFGLSRSTTRAVAQARAAGQDAAPAAGVSVTVQTLLGALIGAGLVAAADPIAGLIRSGTLERDLVVRVLRLIGAGLPLVVAFLALRAVLEGAQRFGLLNLITLPATVLNFAAPAAAAAAGWSLPAIVTLLIALRGAGVLAALLAVRATLPGFAPGLALARLAGQWRFGAWIAVSNLVSPLLLYAERFLLSGTAGLAAVGVYTPPFELLSRALVLPSAIVRALFPVFSAATDPVAVRALARRAVAVTGALLVPPLLVLALFAPPVLAAWLGPGYGSEGALVLRLLAVGTLVNAMAHVPVTVLQGLGRADVVGRLHLGEVPLHLVLTWMLVLRWGAAGAAAAWSLRAVVDAAALFLLSRGVIAGMRAQSGEGAS